MNTPEKTYIVVGRLAGAALLLLVLGMTLVTCTGCATQTGPVLPKPIPVELEPAK